MRKYLINILLLLLITNSYSQTTGTYYLKSSKGDYIGITQTTGSRISSLGLNHNIDNSTKFKISYNDNIGFIISGENDFSLSGIYLLNEPKPIMKPEFGWTIEPLGFGNYSIQQKKEGFGNIKYYLSVSNINNAKELLFNKKPYPWKLIKIQDDGFNPYTLLRITTSNLVLNPIHNNDCKRLQGDVSFSLKNLKTNEIYKQAKFQSGYSPLNNSSNHVAVNFRGNLSRDFKKRDLNVNEFYSSDVDYYVLTTDLVEGNIHLEGKGNLKGCHKDNEVTGYRCNIKYEKLTFNSARTTSPTVTAGGVLGVTGVASIVLNPNISTPFFVKANDGHILSGTVKVMVLNNPY